MEGRVIELINGGGYVAIGAFLFYMVLRVEKALLRIHERMDKIADKFVTKEECARCGRRIDAIESEYQSKTDFYRDMEGWREEINRLNDKLDRVMDKVMEVARR